MRRYTLALTFLGAFVLIGCSNGTRTSTESPRSSNGTAANKFPLPPEYRTLAKIISLDIRSDPKQYRDDKGMAEIIGEGHTAVMALRDIKSSDSDINYYS